MLSSSPTEVLSADPDLLTGLDPFVDGTPPRPLGRWRASSSAFLGCAHLSNAAGGIALT